MNQSYQEDPNRQLVYPPIPPVQPPAQSSGFVNYIKNNKLLVLIIVIVIIALLWWFFVKRNQGDVVTTTTAVPSTNSKIQVTKTRLNNMY